MGGGLFNLSMNLTLTSNTFTGNTASTGLSNVYTPPMLTMTVLGGNLQFSWPTNEVGFSVQSTTNLLSANTWQALGSAVTTDGAFFQQSSTGTPGHYSFFRLIYNNP